MDAMKFETACSEDRHRVLVEMAEWHAEQAWSWWQDGLDQARSLDTAAERRDALALLREERDRRRSAGEHFDTASAIIAYYLAAELDRRGWLQRQWRPIPHGAARLPGRRWGSTPAHLVGRLRVHLPDELGEHLRRATWWTSLPATKKLQALADRHGPGRVPPEVAREREQLRAKIVTTGDLLRLAQDHAVQAWASSPEQRAG